MLEFGRAPTLPHDQAILVLCLLVILDVLYILELVQVLELGTEVFASLLQNAFIARLCLQALLIGELEVVAEALGTHILETGSVCQGELV